MRLDRRQARRQAKLKRGVMGRRVLPVVAHDAAPSGHPSGLRAATHRLGRARRPRPGRTTLMTSRNSISRGRSRCQGADIKARKPRPAPREVRRVRLVFVICATRLRLFSLHIRRPNHNEAARYPSTIFTMFDSAGCGIESFMETVRMNNVDPLLLSGKRSLSMRPIMK